MAQTYSIEFKEEACKRVQSGVPAAQVARELGVNVIPCIHGCPALRNIPQNDFVKIS